MLEVAEHYERLGGRSPLNDQVRQVIAALRRELDAHRIFLPIYWGNRNWHPLLPDALRQMAHDNVRRGLAVVLSGFSSYSSCRQYRENIEDARRIAGPSAPEIDKVRVFYNHPGFVGAIVDCVRAAIDKVPESSRDRLRIAFTAHSVPVSMAQGSDYAAQLAETSRLVADEVSVGPERWSLVYQSRSGRPEDPWLGPDICDHLHSLHAEGVRDVVVVPVGFLSDHVEVLYDLDEEAQGVAESLGLNMVRAATVGTHPRFVSMLRGLIEERLGLRSERAAIGRYGPSHDVCPADCCPAPARPARSASSDACLESGD
jgi:ferrochelatase